MSKVALLTISFLKSSYLLPAFILATAGALNVAAAEDVSFYGQRNVVSSEAKPQTTTQHFHRRVIAPIINSETPTQTSENEQQALNEKSEDKKLNTEIPLSRNDLLLAKKAHYYFKRNYRKETGLWDSVQGYSHTTMWDIASGIAATLSLEALGIVNSESTRNQLNLTLDTLYRLPLYNDELPNREYSTKTAMPSGRNSDTKRNGNGWSALDIGRLLIWLNILQIQHPEFQDRVTAISQKWKLERAVNNGTLYGVNYTSGKEYYRQEGRNGYLQYAAQGFIWFDYDVSLPNLTDYLKQVEIEGTTLPIDVRNVPFFTSDPFVLASIEYGQHQAWNKIESIYQVHMVKWKEQGIISAYAEDAMNKNPWFAYNNLYYYGKPWTSVSPSGKIIENPQVFSNKVAFGFSVIFHDNFSRRLYDEVLENSLHSRSIPTGKYENDGSNTAFNINTNSMILVALWYKSRGGKPLAKG